MVWHVVVVVSSLNCVRLLQPHGLEPANSSVYGILQARILEWVAIFFSRESFPPRNHIQGTCIAGKLFTKSAMSAYIYIYIYMENKIQYNMYDYVS